MQRDGEVEKKRWGGMREECDEKGTVWDEERKEIGLKGEVIMDQGSKVVREKQGKGTRERRKKKQSYFKEAKEIKVDI